MLSSTAKREPNESLLLMSLKSPSNSNPSLDKQSCDHGLCGKAKVLTEGPIIEKNFQTVNCEFRIGTRPNKARLKVLTENKLPNSISERNANICAINAKYSECACTASKQQPLEERCLDVNPTYICERCLGPDFPSIFVRYTTFESLNICDRCPHYKVSITCEWCRGPGFPDAGGRCPNLLDARKRYPGHEDLRRRLYLEVKVEATWSQCMHGGTQTSYESLQRDHLEVIWALI